MDFKSFADATLHLGPFTVIVGANAAGKSNIRDAFRFVHGIGRGYTLAEIIGGKYGQGGQAEWAPIRGSAKELIRFGEDSFLIEVGAKIQGTEYTYAIKIREDMSSRVGFRVISEELRSRYRVIFTSNPGGDDPVSYQDEDNHLLLRMEKTGDQRRYGLRINPRDDQPAISQVSDFSRVVRSQKELVLQILEEFESIRFLDLVPEAMRKPSFPGQTILGDNGENLATVLQGICQTPSKEQTLYEWIRELTPLDVERLDFVQDGITGLIQLAIRESNGNVVSSYSASDGTLRFLAMLAALLGEEPARFYFFEELDNGIHPARLKLLADLIENVTSNRRTQVVTTTHSPELIAMISPATFENLSVVYRMPNEDHADIRRTDKIPHLAEVSQRQSVARLLTGGWFEDALAFAEASTK
jgi:predicted ATPase